MVTVHDLVKETGTSKVLWTERETNFNSCEARDKSWPLARTFTL